METEPSVLLTEIVELGPLKHMPQKSLFSVVYLEMEVTPELHFTSEEEPTNNVWYLDNGASNHMTRD